MRPTTFLIAAALASVACVAAADQDKEHPMTSHTVTGPFDVQLAPQSLSGVADKSGLGRMSLDKRFHGALEAASTGEMLAFRSATPGSAGYVAMETVRGTLRLDQAAEVRLIRQQVMAGVIDRSQAIDCRAKRAGSRFALCTLPVVMTKQPRSLRA